MRDLRAVFGRRLEEESGGDLISLLRIKKTFFFGARFRKRLKIGDMGLILLMQLIFPAGSDVMMRFDACPCDSLIQSGPWPGLK